MSTSNKEFDDDDDDDEIRQIAQWADYNNLSFNISKSKEMFFRALGVRVPVFAKVNTFI